MVVFNIIFLFHYLEESEFEQQSTQKAKRTPSHGGKTRKRRLDPKSWKQSTCKRLRQSGKAYTSSKAKQVSARAVKTTKNCAQTIFRMMIGGKYLKAFGQCLVKKSNILSILQRRGFLKGDVVRTKVKILESHIPIITISFLMMFAIVYVKNSTCLHWISAADGFLISTKIKTQKLVYLPNRNGANMQRRSCPHLQAIRTRSHQFHTKA